MTAPVVCDVRYGPNEYVETYRGYQIWRCYAPPPIPGQPSIAVYYELGHPNESRSTNIENVRNWIDANLAPLVAALAGHVRDKSTGKPIAGATVTANGYAAKTDASGYYYIELPYLGGVYTVQVTADGYTSQTQRINVPAYTKVVWDFFLEPTAPPTPPGIWEWLQQNWMLVAAVAGAAVVAIGIAVALKRK